MMKNSFDDLDLDLEELNGGLESIEKTEEKQESAPAELAKDSYEEVLRSLRLQCKKTWIGYPVVVDGQLKIVTREIAEATNEEFMAWVEYTWPPSKDSGHKAKEYEGTSVREETVRLLCGMYQRLEMKGVNLSKV